MEAYVEWLGCAFGIPIVYLCLRLNGDGTTH